MDRVRLGRALGYGTRHAAKTVAAVVGAAAAPGPATRPGSEATPRSAGRPVSAAAASRPVAHTAAEAFRRPVGAGVRHGARSLWKPLAVYSGALWLRVTGLFFAVIALSLGGGAWRLRGAYRPGSPGAHHFWIFAVFAAVFAYFAVSSFVRAMLKERRAARGSR